MFNNKKTMTFILFLAFLMQHMSIINSQVVIRLYTATNPDTPVVINNLIDLSGVNGFNVKPSSRNYMIVHGFRYIITLKVSGNFD